jgi:hypothetical protein
MNSTTTYGLAGYAWLQVIKQLRGELSLPWEEDMSPQKQRGLGAFKGPVLQLLHRDPEQRFSMRRFHGACTHLFSGRTTGET